MKATGNHEAARILFEAATLPFIVAGGAHALAALVDVRRPTFFDPTSEGVRAGMAQSGIRLFVMPMALLVSVCYFALSLPFWFYGPAIVTGTGMACFALAYLFA